MTSQVKEKYKLNYLSDLIILILAGFYLYTFNAPSINLNFIPKIDYFVLSLYTYAPFIIVLYLVLRFGNYYSSNDELSTPVRTMSIIVLFFWLFFFEGNTIRDSIFMCFVIAVATIVIIATDVSLEVDNKKKIIIPLFLTWSFLVVSVDAMQEGVYLSSKKYNISNINQNKISSGRIFIDRRMINSTTSERLYYNTIVNRFEIDIKTNNENNPEIYKEISERFLFNKKDMQKILETIKTPDHIL